jgi:chloride channel protein, CIC family
MVFEMTLNYGVILPLMLVCVTAYYAASSLETDSIYSESRRRKRAYQATREPRIVAVSDLLKPLPPHVQENAPFLQVAQFFTTEPYNHLMVVSPDGQLQGDIALQDVKNYLQSAELANLLTASDLMRTHFQAVTPTTPLANALEAFRHHAGERLPVVSDPQHPRLIGCISKTDLLLALAHNLRDESA